MSATNPFVVLSYVGGPALLTNATSLFILSTSNRFARAVDRARALAGQVGMADELRAVHRRVTLIARAMTSFYFAAAMFALGTLGSIAGAAAAEVLDTKIVGTVIVGAAIVGLAGFVAFVIGSVGLVFEVRIAARMIAREAQSALSGAGEGT
jgi:hypothetical protein